MNEIVKPVAGFVLDLGCGEGSWLRDNGGKNVGLDVDRALLEKAEV